MIPASRLEAKIPDTGKKVKGRKHHIIVDTLSLFIKAVVHSADVQDRNGAMRKIPMCQQSLKQ